MSYAFKLAGLVLVLIARLPAVPAISAGGGDNGMDIVVGISPYTTEKIGQLSIRVPDGLIGKKLVLDLLLGARPLASRPFVPDRNPTLLLFSLGDIPDGENEITCRLRGGDIPVAPVAVHVVKLPPKPNEVKVNHVTRSLIVDGRPFLPFGFYSDPDIGDLPETESANGFNLITPYWGAAGKRTPEETGKIRARMDRCAAAGMRVNYDLRVISETLEGREQEDALRAEVESFRDHPALLAWYIADEPEDRNIPPDRLIRACRLIKSLDPYHPVAICMVGIDRAPQYSAACDFIMPDAYPIPHQPVTIVGDWVDKALGGTQHRKPVWFIPQVFGGGEFWYREPTAGEVRVMTYLALMHGATGIQYFIRRPAIVNPKSPIVWSECRTLAMEASQLAPAILSGEPAPRIRADPAYVQSRAFSDRGVLFIVAANTRNQPATLHLRIEGRTFTGNAHAIFERRRVPVNGGLITDMIDSLDTRIYRLETGPLPKDDLTVSADNLVANPSFEECVSAGSVANCYFGAGESRDATILLDPLVARHGRHSVRMTVPSAGTGVRLIPMLLKDSETQTTEESMHPWPFWFRYEKGREYRISVWAKGKTPGLTFRISDPNLEGLPKDFTLSTEWRKYEISGVARSEKPYGGLGLQLVGPGTAWFDLMEVIPQAFR